MAQKFKATGLTDWQGKPIVLANPTTIEGKEYAQVLGRWEGNWWPTDGKTAGDFTIGNDWFIDLDEWTPEYCKRVITMAKIAMVLNRRVAKSEHKRVVAEAKERLGVRQTARRMEERGVAKTWFG